MASSAERLYPLKPCPAQVPYWRSTLRFIISHSGRRSGKTEIAKRKFIKRAMRFHAWPDGRFFACAPVQNQANRIYWEDFKDMIPRALQRKVSESDKTITLVTGTTIGVAGMDKPERLEGMPLDGVLMDEYADMRADAWGKHVRPALSTPGRPGWAMFIGVPEGRNHFYELISMANIAPQDWGVFHWPSWEVLDPAEIEAAKRDLDELTFRQEYGGEFVSFEGRAYYAYDEKLHAGAELEYNPHEPLDLCFDFNVEPGVAIITQEQDYKGPRKDVDQRVTACLGEVWLPVGSNTLRVCAEIARDWGGHKGQVRCFGDASGGARKSSAIAGSDWDLIRQALGKVFGDRLVVRAPLANPPERVRINALNSRLLSAEGKVKLLINQWCPNLKRDLDQVSTVPGSGGKLDKSNPLLTHMTDALGYKVCELYPIYDWTVKRSALY